MCQIRGNNTLDLYGLALVGGFALQGGVALAIGDGANIYVTDCWFADCAAVGDGGCLLAVGPKSSVSVSKSARIHLPSLLAFYNMQRMNYAVFANDASGCDRRD